MLGQSPQLPPSPVVNGASFRIGGAAPGGIVSLFGSNLSQVVEAASTTPLPDQLNFTSVWINGGAAPLYFVSPGQINLQIPAELGPGAYNIQVGNSIYGSATATITVARSSPGIFTTNEAGSGQGVVFNAGYALVDGSAPATAGDTVQVYCTGLGAATPPVATGSLGPANPPAVVNSAVTATIGGIPAKVLSAIVAPGYVGLYQVDVTVPAGVPTGNAVAIVLTQTDLSTNPPNSVSSNSATIAIR